MIAVFADGLGYHYLQNSRISEAFEECFASTIPLRSLLGFSTGILPSIWTSSYPYNHGFWAEFLLENSYSPQPVRIGYKEWALSCLLQFAVKKIQTTLGRSSSLHPTIPSAMRRLFTYNYLDIGKPFLMESPKSIFSVLSENEVRYSYSACQRIDDFTLPRYDYDAIFLHLGEFDGLGHFNGPRSPLVEQRILKFLSFIKQLRQKSDSLCLFSDHGMFPIKSRLDILSRLNKTHLDLGLDYMVFLDATMARFWFFSNHAENEIVESLSSLPGHFLTNDEIAVEGLQFNNNSYGEKIFLLNPSCEVYPNFFHPINRNYLKGLHGYSTSAENSNALFAATFETHSRAGTLLDVAPTILKVLGLDQPKEWKGQEIS